jgi:diguanylate cyclase (GGDEF)-like protein
MKFPIPENEAERLKDLQNCRILDTPTEQEYDDLVLLAAQICGTPIATITFVSEQRAWHKSKTGIDQPGSSREDSFCTHAIMNESSEIMIVQDALKDERFAENPLVTGEPHIRFYVGAPLTTQNNSAIGTLCVIDRQPRRLSEQQIEAFKALARQTSLKLELRQTSLLLQEVNENLQNLSLTDDLTELNNRRGFLFHAEQQLKLFNSRRMDKGLWVMLADIDSLKHINDNFGHHEGSEAIVNAGQLLKKTFRNSDVVARFGGDEFAVLIINALDEVKEKIVEQLENNLAAYNASSGKPYELSISYGLASVVLSNKTSIEEAVKQADESMYRHKRSRRNSSLPLTK